MSIEMDIALIRAELFVADEKHPGFVSGVTTSPLETVKGRLTWARQMKAKEETFDRVMAEELYEAIEAHEEGRIPDCLRELAQCGAVILRMMEKVREEIGEKRSNNAELARLAVEGAAVSLPGAEPEAEQARPIEVGSRVRFTRRGFAKYVERMGGEAEVGSEKMDELLAAIFRVTQIIPDHRSGKWPRIILESGIWKIGMHMEDVEAVKEEA